MKASKEYSGNTDFIEKTKLYKNDYAFFKIFFYYLRDKAASIIKLSLFISTYFLTEFLYGTVRESTIYASILACSAYLVFLIYDFNKYYKKHLLLKNIEDNLENGVDNLEISNNLIESDYNYIINSLYETKTHLIAKSSDDRDKMVNYYTMWAHQIKTPISALSMMIQSMENGDEKNIMQEQLFKTEQYIEMVLHYIRLENFSSDLKINRYSLKNIVNACVKKYSVQFIHNKIALNIENVDKEILTDEKWISFVLEQILSNSLKYTKKGKISIYMDDKLSNTLVIEDTGIGISEEDIPRVFENGFTGYNGRVNKKSSGIGLFLCKQIIDKLNNKIYIKSIIGEGTKVYIDFTNYNIEIE